MVKTVKQGVHTERFGFWGSIVKDMTYLIKSYLRADLGFWVNRSSLVLIGQDKPLLLYCKFLLDLEWGIMLLIIFGE